MVGPLRAVVFLFGFFLIGSIVWEVFETIILPRRVQRKFRITRFFYLTTWRPFRAFAGGIQKRKLREELLSFYGPASLLVLFGVWAVGLVFACGCLFWGSGANLVLHEDLRASFWTDLYFSGTNFFTLGLGEVIPHSGVTRLICVIEAGFGLGFLALVIAYLPTLYSAFSNREVNISLLDARAGSPATAGELLRRHSLFGDLHYLDSLLADWEHWSATLMESHISYPVLCHFRSQHDNQSWVAALTTVLDTCALVMTGIEGVPTWQARLTFAISRHALVDIAQVFHQAPVPVEVDRLPPAAFAQLLADLGQANVVLASTPEAGSRLRQLRDMYEPYASALSEMLLMPLPPWTRQGGAKDNWTTSTWKGGE